MSATLELTKALINRPSLTPNDAGCQDIIGQRLKTLGFTLEPMRFGDVDNLWARHGKEGPLFVFAGHTDVVPTGPLEAWSSDPFVATERGEYLYGRGATDMKSGLAAMVIATQQFITKHPNYPGSIGFLITSDEEGPSINGTRKVMEQLIARNEMIDYCVIGEATSEKILGDQIRIGRRGSFHGKVIIQGKQGHVAFPENALNPIHACFAALDQLAKETWDNGNEFFPPTTFQFSNIHAGTGAKNVIPGTVEADFNFRFSTAVTTDELMERVTHLLKQHKVDFEITWDLSGDPFLTKKGKLITATQLAILSTMDIKPVLSTGGGTSDGRFIAPSGAEVIELGPINKTAHHVNEHTSMKDLEKLTVIYEKILEKVFL